MKLIIELIAGEVAAVKRYLVGRAFGTAIQSAPEQPVVDRVLNKLVEAAKTAEER